MKNAFLILLLFTGYSAVAQIYWNFNDANPFSGLPAGITVSAVSVGNTSTTNDSFISSASSSSGYTGFSGGNNGAIAAKAGDVNPSTSSYFEVSLTATATASIKISGLSFGIRSTTSGPLLYSIFSSLDNFETPLISGSVQNNSNWSLASFSFSSILQPGQGNPITLRIYGSGGSSASAGNWRIDDLAIIHASTLPVSLTSFSGKAFNDLIQLNWQTMSEFNSDYFELMKSDDGKKFNSIGKVNAAGNSFSSRSYSFTDYFQDGGDSYYQLNQVDLDGKVHKSQIIHVQASSTSSLSVSAILKNNVQFDVLSATNTKVRLLVMDITGKKYHDSIYELKPGANKVDVPIEHNGLVLIAVLEKKGETVSYKFYK